MKYIYGKNVTENCPKIKERRRQTLHLSMMVWCEIPIYSIYFSCFENFYKAIALFIDNGFSDNDITLLLCPENLTSLLQGYMMLYLSSLIRFCNTKMNFEAIFSLNFERWFTCFHSINNKRSQVLQIMKNFIGH